MYDDDDENDVALRGILAPVVRKVSVSIPPGEDMITKSSAITRIEEMIQRTTQIEPSLLHRIFGIERGGVNERVREFEQVFNAVTRMEDAKLEFFDKYRAAIVKTAEMRNDLLRLDSEHDELQRQRDIADSLAGERAAHAREMMRISRQKTHLALMEIEDQIAERLERRDRSAAGRTTVTAGAKDFSTLARRIVDDAMSGSVAPDQPDRYFHPLAGAIYTVKMADGASQATAANAAYEVVHRALQLDASGKVPMTRARAQQDYASYQEARTTLARTKNLDDVADLIKGVTGGAADGKDIFE